MKRLTAVPAGLLLLLAPLIFLTPYRLGLLAVVATFTIASLAQNLLTGYAGVPSLGNISFFAVSAYVTAYLISGAGTPAFFAILAGIAAAGVLGLVVGVPALRISGMHLAIVTVALVYVSQEVMQQWDQAHVPHNASVSAPAWLLDDAKLYVFATVLAVVLYVLCWNLMRSRSGRAILACNDNPFAAAAVGINVNAYRLGVFVLSGAITGVAGSIFLYSRQTVTPATFSLDLSLAFLTMVILGGSASLGGSILGGVIIGYLQPLLNLLPAHLGSISVQSSTAALYALLLLIALRFFPDGLYPAAARIAQHGFELYRRVAGRRPISG